MKFNTGNVCWSTALYCICVLVSLHNAHSAHGAHMEALTEVYLQRMCTIQLMVSQLILSHNSLFCLKSKAEVSVGLLSLFKDVSEK